MWTKFRFLIFLAASLCLNANAATFIYNADGTQSQTVDGITVKLEKGGNTSNAPAYSSYNGMKMYANNTITIDAAQAFKNVQLVFSKNENKDYLAMTASVGELVSGGTSTALGDKKIDVWNGETNHLVFTMGTKGQRIIFQIVVDGDPIYINPQSDVVAIDTAEWDPDFAWYSEPTAVITPDTNFFKKEYIFVSSNIRVHCTQGSILSNDTAYYFNCNAGQTISFEAAKPIKGLVINGAVRKLFQATSDQGSMAYISPDAFYPEDYQECESAVIITDIDAKKVTISCEKQLRCYSVYFYFDANPTQEIWDCDGGTSGGETVFLNFDTADAVYESEISADEGKTNYTIYLYNQASPDFPYLTLDLYPAAQGDLVGMYNMEDGSLGETTWYQYGESAYDRAWMETEGQLVINKEGEVYSISGYITCDDNNTYNFTYNGVMPFYEDTEYYSTEDIETVPAMDRHAPLYDVLGRKVNDTYKGIVIQNGHKYVLK